MEKTERSETINLQYSFPACPDWVSGHKAERKAHSVGVQQPSLENFNSMRHAPRP